MKFLTLLFLAASSIFVSCAPQEAKVAEVIPANKMKISKADKTLAKAIAAHGGHLYDAAHYQFVFRKKKYTFKNDGASYAYTVSNTKDGVETIDYLNNKGFMRKVNDEIVNLTEKQIRGYTGSINSVIYFATLPHKLQDEAVKKAYKGETTIKENKYHILEVTFNEAGGGQDHDDEFHYWINQKTNTIDYLAYNYQVNNGGVRFRAAFNTRIVDGILFQDYINYKAEVGTPLAALPALYEKEELKELSIIATEDIINLKK